MGWREERVERLVEQKQAERFGAVPRVPRVNMDRVHPSTACTARVGSCREFNLPRVRALRWNDCKYSAGQAPESGDWTLG